MPRVPGRKTSRVQVEADRLEVAYFAAPWDGSAFGQPCCVVEHQEGLPLNVGDPANSVNGNNSPGRVNFKGGDPWSRSVREGTVGWACPRCVDLIAGLGSE